MDQQAEVVPEVTSEEAQRILLLKEEEAKNELISNILVYPSKQLNVICEEVTPDHFESGLVAQVVDRLRKVIDLTNAIGLAAPQVSLDGKRNVNLRILCWNIPSLHSSGVLVNPKLTFLSEEKETLEEGCVSCPGLKLPVERSKNIKFTAMDEFGTALGEIEAEGLIAKCIQHEIDHLNGTLLVSRLSNLKKDIYKRKLQKQFKEWETKKDRSRVDE